MLTYECEATIGDIAIYCMGAVVAHFDDLEVTFELDGEGALVTVKLPVDTITGKSVKVAPALGYPKFPDTNSEEIWRAAQVELAEHRDQYREKANIPPPVAEEPEWTGPEYRRAPLDLNIGF